MNKEFLQNLREQIKAGTVTEQEPMNKHTSFAIGGPADVFVQPATREEIRSAVYCAKEAGIPFFVMGNGSNLPLLLRLSPKQSPRNSSSLLRSPCPGTLHPMSCSSQDQACH